MEADHYQYERIIPFSDIDEHAQLLESFVETLDEVELPRQSPWWGFWAMTVNPNDLEPVADLLKQLGQAATDAELQCSKLHSECGEGLLKWLIGNSPSHKIELAMLADDAAGTLSILQDATIRKQAAEFSSLVLAANELLKESSRYLAGDRVEAERLAPEIQRLIEQRLKPTAGEGTIQKLRALKSRLSTLLTVLESVDSTAQQLQSQGMGPIRNLKEYQQAEEIFRLLRHQILKSVAELPLSLFLAQAPAIYKQAIAESASLDASREELGKAFQWEGLPDLEQIRSVTKRIRPHVDRWWRFLSRDFRSAKKELHDFSRSGIGESPPKWVSKLEKLEDHLAAEKKFSDRSDLTQILGG